ncbi:MAG: M48 family metallopeptidase [Thermoleophilia bacterium]|nr:M48 family metallopeptidase [Thermoleophilia bacterium]
MSAERKGRDFLTVGSLLWIAAAAVLLAFLLAWLLGPGGGIDAPQVDAAKYLDHDLIERAGEYRSESRLLAITSMLLGLIVLAGLAVYRGRFIRSTFDRLGRWPIIGAAAAGAGITALLALVRFPLDLIQFNHGRDYGLITQDFSGWLSDLLLGTLIGLLMEAAGAALAMWLWRRFRQRFWIAGSIFVIAYAVLFTWLWPVVISPLFNTFEPLPEGPVRQEVIRLADRAGVEVGQVYEVDASRRSSTLNAYVNGLGSSKRVVIYDNAIDQLSDAELSALIAHELSHVESNDLYRGLAFAILVIPLGVLFVQVATTALARRRGDDLRGPAIIPALALTISLATMVLSIPGNLLSREIEAGADRSAMELTGNPDGLIGLQVRLAESNLTDPDPPGVYQYLFGSHPTTVERISAAETEKDQGGGG